MADDRRPDARPDELTRSVPHRRCPPTGATLPGAGAARAGAAPRPAAGSRSGSSSISCSLLAAAPTLLSSVKKTPANRVGISYGGGPIEGVALPADHRSRVPACSSTVCSTRCTCTRRTSRTTSSRRPRRRVRRTAPTRSPRRRATGCRSVPGGRVLQAEHRPAPHEFHEQLGLKYQAYTSPGWSNMLQDTFRQQIESADPAGDPALHGRRAVRQRRRCSTNMPDRRCTAHRACSSWSPSARSTSAGRTTCPAGSADPITFFIKRIDIPLVGVLGLRSRAGQPEAAEAVDAIAEALKAAGTEYTKLQAINSGKVTFWN